MIRLLITGGAGFIGSHTCVALLEKGYEIISLDSYINSSPKVYEGILEIFKNKGININNKLKIIKGDLRDKDKVNEIFREAKRNDNPIGGVIHFAGLKSVAESVINPILYWEYNLISTLNLISAMLEFECFNIVFSSSATIYGITKERLLNEGSNIKPSNPYGNTKATIETFLRDIFKSQQNKLRIANLRYFNPIGAHPSGLIGEDPKGTPNNIFPLLTRVALGKIKYLNIFGKDWPTIDGTGIRDYIHVMDLAEGHIKIFEHLINHQPKIEYVNLGTGMGTSVLELISVFNRANGTKIPYKFVDRRPGDIAEIVADNNYMKTLVNWCPEKNIIDMCKDGFNWQLKNPDGFISSK